jgi:hypothetical protein
MNDNPRRKGFFWLLQDQRLRWYDAIAVIGLISASRFAPEAYQSLFGVATVLVYGTIVVPIRNALASPRTPQDEGANV